MFLEVLSLSAVLVWGERHRCECRIMKVLAVLSLAGLSPAADSKCDD